MQSQIFFTAEFQIFTTQNSNQIFKNLGPSDFYCDAYNLIVKQILTISYLVNS